MIYSVIIAAFALLYNAQTLAFSLNEDDYTPTSTTLYNGEVIPLVGTGVGNLQHELIRRVLRSMMDHEKKVYLIDTAKASRNEEYIAETVAQLLPDINIKDDQVIHVVTKVWYTHLGYERTMLSVHESMKELSSYSGPNPVHVHVLLHWPRCNNEISWMHCEEEENNLPQYVKESGPPPHLNPNAWKDSWRALEDIYTEHQGETNDAKVKVASIGISNFDFNEFNTIVFESRIKPHMIQGNVWQVLFDKYSMNLVKKQNVFFQAYNVMNGILLQKTKCPHAFSILTNVARKLQSRMLVQYKGREDELMPLSEAMIVSAWLLQQGIGIIPRASDNEHQWENAAETLKFVPTMNTSERDVIGHAMEALMKGEDVSVEATFQNNVPSGPIHVHWVNKETGEEQPVIKNLAPGKFEIVYTHPGHLFHIYDESMEQHLKVDVNSFYGERAVFPIDSFDVEDEF